MRIRSLSVLAACLGLAAGCGGDSLGPASTGKEPAAIKIAPERVSLNALGDTVRFTATLYDERGQPITGKTTVSWTVRDTAIAVVDAAGLVRARGNGTTLVSAIVGRRSGMATVDVRQLPATLSVTAPVSTLAVGDTLRLSVAARDAKGEVVADADVTWSSSDTAVARVDGAGLVRGVGPGKAQITAVAGTAEAAVEVEVIASPTVITSITPAVLFPGVEAELVGGGFSAVASRNRVEVDGVAATVLSATETRLRVRLPALDQFRCGPRRDVRVTVQADKGLGAFFHPLVTASTIELAVGQDRFLTGAEARCLELPAASADYLVGVYNTSTSATALSGYRLRGSRGTEAVAPTRVVAALAPRPIEPVDPAELRHFQHLEEERRLYELLGPVTQKKGVAAPVATLADPPPAVGTVIDFRIRQRGASNSCTQYQTIRTRVAHVGPQTIFLEDTTAPLAGKMDEIYRAAAEVFEQEMLPILRDYYGNPFAMDQALGSDGRIRIVLTPIVNADGLNGFVTSADLRDRAQCPSSTMAPTMYVRVATGTGSSTPEQWLRTMIATLIHEAKHIVSHAERISQSASRFEESWLEESTARLAEELWARTKLGYTQGSNVDYRTGLYCEDPPGRVGCTGKEPRVMHKHFGQFRNYLRDTAGRTPLGRATDSDDSFYGSGWSLVRWAVDHSGKTERDFLRALTKERSLAGAQNLEARTGKSFAEIIGYWSFSNFLDDYPGVTTRPELQNPSWNLRDAFRGLHETFPSTYTNTFPLVPRQRAFGDFVIDVDAVRGGGVDFTLLAGSLSAPQYLELLSPSGGAPASTLRLGIVRIR